MDYDVIIIGAGPNGLAVGAYLSKAGQKVLVIEKTHEMGGGLATEEPSLGGFLFNTHSIYHMMTDWAPPYKDFAPEFEGQAPFAASRVKYIYPDPAVAAPFHDGKWLCLYRDVEKACASIAQFSKKDADTYREIRRKYKEYMDEFLGPATYVLPEAALDQLPKLEATPMGKEISDLTPRSPKDIIDSLFENDQVKGLMLYLACHWGLEPEVEGIGYLVPLYLDRHVNHGLCVGGSHQVAGTLLRVIIDNKGDLLTATRIKRIIVENGTATGVEIEDGTVYKAKVVVSTIDPVQTFINLVGENNLKADLVQAVKEYKWEKWSLLSMHLSLWDPPNFSAAAQTPELNKAFMYVFGIESEENVMNHFNDIMANKFSRKPIIYSCFPSVHDPLQVQNNPGRHTGLMTEDSPYKLNGDANNWWSIKLKAERLEMCLGLVGKYAPNMTKDNLMWEYISSPLDVANKFADMVEGSYKQGSYHPLQMGYGRPNSECSQVKTPVKNLYLCGASCHSGGLVTFGPGYIGANVIAEDLGVKKWWSEPETVTNARKKGYF